ncbi:hypothetical protein HU230_0012655 [Bradyrhizobium quebecense]|uniref:Uncharacterized protein n=1 Tax=Bradyrhizobium quebecense TaxID=2748629 RepID=A0A973WQ47_9BRAD|nr:hypothetical protein [Bradyrhizobium quebecense]UGA46840.1 hypothetical protein HU230_0012655 [Bradyrhizobium quebecense]
MKILSKAADGGKDSGVTGFFLIECKALFSIVLLRFSKGTREAYHEHAFDAWTLWLKGRVVEHRLIGSGSRFPSCERLTFNAGQLKHTPRSCFHKIEALDTAWALSIRGPWAARWRELRSNKLVTLTHGRKVVDQGEGVVR